MKKVLLLIAIVQCFICASVYANELKEYTLDLSIKDYNNYQGAFLVGDSFYLKSLVFDDSPNSKMNDPIAELSKNDLIYESSDEKIAIVDENGKVTIKAPGVVSINASASYNGYSFSNSLEFKAFKEVPKDLSSGFFLKVPTSKLMIGKKYQLNSAELWQLKEVVNGVPYSYNGRTLDYEDYEFFIKNVSKEAKWSIESDDEGIAKIDSNGNIIATKEGSIEVKVIYKYNEEILENTGFIEFSTQKDDNIGQKENNKKMKRTLLIIGILVFLIILEIIELIMLKVDNKRRLS